MRAKVSSKSTMGRGSQHKVSTASTLACSALLAFRATFRPEADGASRASATGLWRERWEEESDDQEGSDPVSAKADTWPINEFSDRARKGRLNLSPSYQRGDVWPTSDAQLLIESILRGIPLPSVIISSRSLARSSTSGSRARTLT